jgi:WD40 repeat protein
MWETASLPDKSASTVGLLSSPQTPGPFLAVSALYPGRADTACAREILTLMGNRDGLTCVAVSPDGKRLATASMDGTARVWDLASGRGTCTLLGHTAAVRSIAATPDGRRIVTGSFDKTAKVWDAASGRQLLNLMGHTDGVWRVAVTRDGRRIITGSADGTARVWDAQNGQQLLKLEAERGIRAMALTPDGQRLVTGSFEVAQLWDLGSGQQLRQFKGPRAIISRLAITPDGQRVVMACWDGTTRLLDINTGQEVLKLQEAASGVASVAVAPRGKWLITGRGDGTATVWNIANGREMLSLNGHTDLVTSIAVTPDEQRIATASVDGTVRLWDAQSGRELLTLNPHTGPVWSVAVTPDGRRLITGGNDGTVKIWEAASPEETAAWVRQDQEAERRGAAWQRPGAKAPGFTQDWLVLGPLAVNDNLTGAKRLERQQLPGEAHLHPRAGDHVSVGGEEYAWYAHHWDEPLLDFNRLAQKPNKNRVIYAVCYVISPAERYDLLLQVGSSGPAKLYLNGREVYKCIRNNLGALDPVGPIRLRKGTNVLIVKMVDLVPGGCLRFVDADGNSARGLRVSFIQEP